MAVRQKKQNTIDGESTLTYDRDNLLTKNYEFK